MAEKQKPSTNRKQLRIFALVWVGITVLMGACTFFAIYLASDTLSRSGTLTNLRSVDTNPLMTVTPIPNIASLPSVTPVEEASAEPAIPTLGAQATAVNTIAAAQVLSTDVPPTATILAPTALPVQDLTYQVGIQVQTSPDLNPDNQQLWMREVSDKLHMTWIKQQVRWEDVELERGEFHWAGVDLALNTAAEYEMKVMLSIVTAPAWSREPGVNVEQHGPPADFQDYVNFVTAILQRHPGKVHAIEVWNEQNLDREWTSINGLSAANYVNMLRQTTQAVKAIDPGIIIISGALSPTGGWTEPDGTVTAIDDFSYMDDLIAAGMLNYTDCVGAHHNGYNIGPSVTWDNVPDDPTATFRGPFDNPHHSWSFRSTLETYKSKIELAGGEQKLCVTEFGWASTEDLDGFPPGFDFANDNTLEEQKTWLVEAMDNMREWDNVWLAFVWNMNYGPQAGWDPQNDNVPYSLIGKDWNFRPAYDAIGQWQLAYQEEIAR